MSFISFSSLKLLYSLWTKAATEWNLRWFFSALNHKSRTLHQTPRSPVLPLSWSIKIISSLMKEYLLFMSWSISVRFKAFHFTWNKTTCLFKCKFKDPVDYKKIFFHFWLRSCDSAAESYYLVPAPVILINPFTPLFIIVYGKLPFRLLLANTGHGHEQLWLYWVMCGLR